jgi:hypothetical protein
MNYTTVRWPPWQRRFLHPAAAAVRYSTASCQADPLLWLQCTQQLQYSTALWPQAKLAHCCGCNAPCRHPSRTRRPDMCSAPSTATSCARCDVLQCRCGTKQRTPLTVLNSSTAGVLEVAHLTLLVRLQDGSMFQANVRYTSYFYLQIKVHHSADGLAVIGIFLALPDALHHAHSRCGTPWFLHGRR